MKTLLAIGVYIAVMAYGAGNAGNEGYKTMAHHNYTVAQAAQ